jgi:nitrogen fixation protein FixH
VKAGTKWILAIVGLLAANMIAMVVLATAARIGHSEVIPDYYEQATHYDDALAQLETNRQLGWRVAATIERGELEVAVADRAGAPIGDATVRASGLPRAHASERFDRALDVRGDGRYAGAIDAYAGVHDVTVVVERGGATYVEHAVVVAR